MQKYIIYTGPYKIQNLWCKVIGCNNRVYKVFIYVTVQYANYESDFYTKSNWCTLK